MKGRSSFVCLLIIILLAASLRFYRIGYQSLWADEGNSVRLAERSLPLITKGAAADIHPPLYYYTLHFWVRFFGLSEFAVRSLSAIFGTAVVYVTFLLGRRLFDMNTALVAALLAALSPFQVYYSQEARMYILVTLLGALSVLFFVKILDLEKSKKGDSSVYLSTYLPFVLFTSLGLYTHYSFPIIIVVENLVYFLWMARSLRRRGFARLSRWIAAQTAVFALYSPWLPIAYERMRGWPAISEAHSFSFIMKEAFRLFSLGHTVEAGGITTWLLLGFALIFLIGLSKRCEPSGLHTYLLTLLYCVSPVLMMCALSLLKPSYRPKFFLIGAPAFCLILARGVLPGKRRWIIWSVICLLFVTLASASSLYNYYFERRYARDDYRGIVGYISALGKEGDAILLNAPNQWEVFTYYYKGSLPIYPISCRHREDEGKTAEELEEIIAQHERIFAVLWATEESDPGRFVEGWLSRHTYKAQDDWYGNVRLAIYAMPRGKSIPREIQHPLDLRMGDEIAFIGYNLLTPELRAGEILQLVLFWQALTKPKERYKVFIHILDEENNIVGQHDAEPGGGLGITTIWEEGEIVVDNYGVLVRPGTPPGEYRIEVGMYSLISGQRLPITRGGELIGDHFFLEPIRVLRPEEPPRLAALKIQHEETIEYGELDLLGYDLYKLGYEHKPEEPIHSGDVLHLSLYWRSCGFPTVNWELQLRLEDKNGRIWAFKQGEIALSYPTTEWMEGEVVRDQHKIFIPKDAPSGRYRLVGQLIGEGAIQDAPWVSRWFVVSD